MRQLIATLLALLFVGGAATAQEDWTRYRASVRIDGAVAPARIERTGPDAYRLTLAQGETFSVRREAAGHYVGESTLGAVGRLAGTATAWQIRLDTPRNAEGRWLADGVLRRGRRIDGQFAETSRSAFALILDAAAAVPEHLVLEATDVGATEDELVRDLERRRPDELTVVFLNVGKGEHVNHVPAVDVGGESVDPLNANVRFLATLRPDFLVMAEVSSGAGDRPATLDAGTQGVLADSFPGQLLVPSIWEWPDNNNNAIYSRYQLSHVYGQTPKECWERPAPPTSEDHARVSTRYLDWTPRGLDPATEKRYRAEWGNNNYNTRAHSRIEFVLAGEECVLFPVHFAMPWLEVPRTAIRDGFLVDGLQHHQLHERGPLYHQIERAREDYERLTHGRVVVIGDTNISRHPRAAIRPIPIDPTATGDGEPTRDTALAFELLERGFYDAFAGDDTTWTWPSPATVESRAHLLPRQRIDNCLHGAGFEVVQRSVSFPRGADHAGLLVRLRLRKGEAGPPRAPKPREPKAQPADTDAPTIDVSTPKRGALTGDAAIRVRGVVRDASEVEALWINGDDVRLDAGGAFDHVINLEPGLNVVRLEARDAHGNRTRSVRSVSRGQLLDTSKPVRSAAVVRLNRPAFVWAELGANTKLATLDLETTLLAQNPLVDTRLGSRFASVKVHAAVKTASIGTPSVKIQPGRGALRVTASVPQIVIRLGVSADIRYGPTIHLSAKVRARQAVVQAEAVPRVRAGKLVTTLRNVRVRLDGFHIDVRHVPHFVDRFVSERVRAVLAKQVRAQVVAEVPAQIDRLLQIAQRPQTGTVAGHSISLELVPERVHFDPRGVTVVLGANPSGGQGVSLGTPGAPPALTGGQALGVALDDDLLNRTAHIAWRLGLLDQRITADSAVALGAPTWLRRLDAGVVADLLPDALRGVDPAAPLVLEVSPTAAPLLRPLPDGSLEVALGDLEVTLAVAPPGGAPRAVVRAAVTCIARAKVSVSDAGVLAVVLTGRPELHTDVVQGGDSRKGLGLESLLDQLLPVALEKIVAAASGLSLPLPADVHPTGVFLAPEGPEGDYLAVWADVPSPAAVFLQAGSEALGLPRLFGGRR